MACAIGVNYDTVAGAVVLGPVCDRYNIPTEITMIQVENRGF